MNCNVSHCVESRSNNPFQAHKPLCHTRTSIKNIRLYSRIYCQHSIRFPTPSLPSNREMHYLASPIELASFIWSLSTLALLALHPSRHQSSYRSLNAKANNDRVGRKRNDDVIECHVVKRSPHPTLSTICCPSDFNLESVPCSHGRIERGEHEWDFVPARVAKFVTQPISVENSVVHQPATGERQTQSVHGVWVSTRRYVTGKLQPEVESSVLHLRRAQKNVCLHSFSSAAIRYCRSSYCRVVHKYTPLISIFFSLLYLLSFLLSHHIRSM